MGQRGELLEPLDDEARCRDGSHDLGQRPQPQPAERLGAVADDDLPAEVVVAPAQGGRVDASAGRVQVDDEQPAARAQSGNRLLEPACQVVQIGEQAGGVDEVEAAAAQIDGQFVRVGLQEDDARERAAGRDQMLLGRVDPRSPSPPLTPSSALTSPVPHCSWRTCLPFRSGSSPRIASGIPGCSVDASTRRRWSWSQARLFSSVGSISDGTPSGEQRVAAVDDQRLAADHLGVGRRGRRPSRPRPPG